MRIQVLSLYYEPEHTGNAPYLTGLAQHLSKSHDVTVITGVPHYPDWRRHAEHQYWRRVDRDGSLTVVRMRHYVPATPTAIRRIPYELSWTSQALVESLRRPADVVIGGVPGLFTSNLAARSARLKRVPSGVVVQDIISRAATSTGMTGVSRMASAIKAVERTGLQAASGIATIHERFAEALRDEYDLPASKIRVIHNWSHIREPSGDRQTTRSALGWKDDETIVLHSGNMGLKQNLLNVVQAARLADTAPASVRFVLAGTGNQRSSLESAGSGIKRLEIRDAVSDAEFPDFLAAADVLLVNELPDVLEMSVPSKLTSYFAAGQPVLAATEAKSATAELIRTAGAGVVVAPGDPQLLLESALALGADAISQRALGTAGQEFARNHLSADAALGAYQNWVESLA